nr:M56 family metallopeptidase [Paenibacillus jilunlii]
MKLLAFLVLVVHWFNPLMWMSFVLMSKDMEMSCDESVLRKLGNGAKAGYSHSLLAFSVKRGRVLSGSPLAFGHNSIHARIKNVLSYKQPKVGLVAAASIVSLLFMVGFMANPAGKMERSVDQVNKLASVWADALVSRDGQPRYEMMSPAMKEQFKQEQAARRGENWNYSIGVSSPWVADYAIRITV